MKIENSGKELTQNILNDYHNNNSIEDTIGLNMNKFVDDLNSFFINYKKEFISKFNTCFTQINEFAFTSEMNINQNEFVNQINSLNAGIKEYIRQSRQNFTEIKNISDIANEHILTMKTSIVDMMNLINNQKPLMGKERMLKTKLSILSNRNDKIFDSNEKIDLSVQKLEKGIAFLFDRVKNFFNSVKMINISNNGSNENNFDNGNTKNDIVEMLKENLFFTKKLIHVMFVIHIIEICLLFGAFNFKLKNDYFTNSISEKSL